jgi:anti-sigma B factor antagonist
MAETQLIVQEYSGVTVANFSGASILDGATVDALGKRLFDLVDNQARRKILLDFTQVKFLSSSMLGVLIRLKKRADAIKGRVVIVGLKPDLHKVFKITRLDKLFEFYDQEDDAMQALGAFGKR